MNDKGRGKPRPLFLTAAAEIERALPSAGRARGCPHVCLQMTAQVSVHLFDYFGNVHRFSHMVIHTCGQAPALFLLVMAGLVIGGMIFNWLNEKLNTNYCSWLTHMFANFAINTIGIMLLK